MKIIFIIISLALLTSISAQSYIRVSNNPNAIADYTNLQTAIDNAPVGATIFVEPAITNYGNITINKRLVLLGGGYDASKHDGKSSTVSTITLNKTGGDPSGTLISGFFFNSIGTSNTGVDSITIERCKGSYIYAQGYGADTLENWKIINSIITSISASRTKNILIANNILTSISGTSDYSLFFTNNIFKGSPTYTYSNLNFSNNIFYSGFPPHCTNCSFSNNLSRVNYNLADCDKNLCTNNIESVPTENIFIQYTTDLHLTPLCPGVGAGSDGTDIGIYGGLYPFPEEDYGAISFPQISTLNITNPVVEPNGTLKVNVKSKIID